jgi:hypothetical protein
MQFSPGFDLQKGHARVIGLTGSTSNARLDFGILLFLLSKQPLTSATTQVMTVNQEDALQAFWGHSKRKICPNPSQPIYSSLGGLLRFKIGVFVKPWHSALQEILAATNALGAGWQSPST